MQYSELHFINYTSTVYNSSVKALKGHQRNPSMLVEAWSREPILSTIFSFVKHLCNVNNTCKLLLSRVNFPYLSGWIAFGTLELLKGRTQKELYYTKRCFTKMVYNLPLHISLILK